MKSLLVAGYGSIGRRHVDNLKKHKFKISVYDKNIKLKKELRSLKIDFLTSLNNIKKKFDGIIISTPTHLHIDTLNLLIDKSDNFLIEKPLTNKPQLLKNIKQMKKKNLFIVCNMRFHPSIKIIKNTINKLGRIYYANAYYGYYLPKMRKKTNYKNNYSSKFSEGGGVIFDTIHEIDYLSWLLGPIKRIHSNSFKLSNLKIDVEDFANIMIEHKNNILSVIQADYLKSFKRRGCEIVGEKGSIIWSSEGKENEHCTVKFYEAKKNKLSKILDTKKLNNNLPYEELINHFIKAIDKKKNDLLSFKEAKKQVEILSKIRKRFHK
tara:strand:- start:1719 stop:2684 length:966 start_codon:yes stop_codon:yes gene_type:complete